MKPELLKSKIIRKIGILLLAATVIAGLCSCGEPRTAHVIEKELVLYYGTYRDEADEKIEELLAELREMDENEYTQWAAIMDYWDYANNELEIDVDKLPAADPTAPATDKAVPGQAITEDTSDTPAAGKTADAASAEIITEDIASDAAPTVAIVVLGYALKEDGSMKPELEGRLETALICAGKYPDAIVVVSGGATAAKNKNATEAGEMAKWLIKKGIAEQRIVVEDLAMSTVQNIQYTYKLLTEDYPTVDSVITVTSDYHVRRATFLFQAYSILDSKGQAEPCPEAAYAAAYELEEEKTEPFRYQASGLLMFIGENDLADQVADGSYKKPKLK